MSSLASRKVNRASKDVPAPAGGGASPAGATRQVAASQVFRSLKAWRDREQDDGAAKAGGEDKAGPDKAGPDKGGPDKAKGEDADIGVDEGEVKQVSAKKVSRKGGPMDTAAKVASPIAAGAEVMAGAGKVGSGGMEHLEHLNKLSEPLGHLGHYLHYIGYGAMFVGLAAEFLKTVNAVKHWRHANEELEKAEKSGSGKDVAQKKVDEMKAKIHAGLEALMTAISAAIAAAMVNGGAAAIGALAATGLGALPAVVAGVGLGICIVIGKKWTEGKIKGWLEKKYLKPLQDALGQPKGKDDPKEGEAGEEAEAKADAESVDGEQGKLSEALKVESGKVAPGNVEAHDRKEAANNPDAQKMAEFYEGKG